MLGNSSVSHRWWAPILPASPHLSLYSEGVRRKQHRPGVSLTSFHVLIDKQSSTGVLGNKAEGWLTHGGARNATATLWLNNRLLSTQSFSSNRPAPSSQASVDRRSSITRDLVAGLTPPVSKSPLSAHNSGRLQQLSQEVKISVTSVGNKFTGIKLVCCLYSSLKKNAKFWLENKENNHVFSPHLS